MSITKEEQLELDNALVPLANRLPFAENNLRLKEDFDPLQPAFKVAMNILDISPIRQALRATASVPETYMHEFWISAKEASPTKITFTIDRKPKTVSVDHFRTIFGFGPIVQGNKFDKFPTKSQIVDFVTSLGYAKTISNVSEINTSKMGQPWRSLFNIIIRCLTAKSSGADSLRLPQAQILWGLYHGSKLDYALLIWTEFHFQGVTNTKKKSNHLQFPRFTKLIIRHFMDEDTSIDQRGMFFYHSPSDDYILEMMYAGGPNIKSKVILIPASIPITMIDDGIKESDAYKDLLKAISKQAKRAASGKTAEEATPTQGKGIRKKREAKRQKTKPSKATAKLSKAEKAKKMMIVDEDEDELATLCETMILLKRSKKETLGVHASGSGHSSKDTEESDNESFGNPDAQTDSEHDEEVNTELVQTLGVHASGSGHPSKDTEESDNESFGNPDAQTDSEHDVEVNTELVQTESQEEDVSKTLKDSASEKIMEEEDKEPAGTNDESEADSSNKEGQDDDEDDERQEEPNSDDIVYEDTEFDNQDKELNQEGGGNEDMDIDHDKFYDDLNINNPDRLTTLSRTLIVPEDARLTVTLVIPDQSKSTSGSDLMNKVVSFSGPDAANEATNTDPSTNVTTNVDLMLRFEQRMKAQEDETSRVKEELARHRQLEETSKKHQEDEIAKVKKQLARLRKMKKKYKKEKKVLAKENETFLKSFNDQMQDIINNEVQKSLNKERTALRKEREELAASKFLIKSSGTMKSEYSIAGGLTDFELKKLLHTRMREVGSFNKTPTQQKLHDILQQAIDEDKETFKTHGSVVPYKRKREGRS